MRPLLFFDFQLLLCVCVCAEQVVVVVAAAVVVVVEVILVVYMLSFSLGGSAFLTRFLGRRNQPRSVQHKRKEVCPVQNMEHERSNGRQRWASDLDAGDIRKER